MKKDKIKYLAVMRLGNGQWLVESETRSGQTHTVEIHDKQLKCSCENALLSHNDNCKHKRLLYRMIQEGVTHE